MLGKLIFAGAALAGLRALASPGRGCIWVARDKDGNSHGKYLYGQMGFSVAVDETIMANSKDQVVIALECKGEKPIGVVSCRRKKCKVWGSGFTPDNKHMFD